MYEPPREPSGFDWTGRFWSGVVGGVVGGFLGWIVSLGSGWNDPIYWGAGFGFTLFFVVGLSLAELLSATTLGRHSPRR